jgi:hypothetical protein
MQFYLVCLAHHIAWSLGTTTVLQPLVSEHSSPCEGEHDVLEEITKLKEHLRRLEDINNKEGYGNIEIEEVNEFLLSSYCMHF